MEYQEEDSYDLDDYPEEIVIDGLRFDMTCFACPEQYDVYKGEEQVGYVRLRWGGLRADYPDVSGLTVYQASVGDGWRGRFNTEKERMFHLQKIAEALNAKHSAEVQSVLCQE